MKDKSTDWHRHLFGRHGQSCTTFSHGMALNAKCCTTFHYSI